MRLRFKGQLLLPSEPGPGLRVDLEVAGHHLAVESESGDLGAWPLETVRVRRLEGDTFAMTVAGEDLHFVAEDTIAFAYSGMPAIERVTGFTRSRGRLRDLLSRFGSDAPDPLMAPTTAPPSQEEPRPQGRAPGVDEQVADAISAAAEISTVEQHDETPDEEEFIDVSALAPSYLLDAPDLPRTPDDWRAGPVSEGPQTATPEPDDDESASCPALTSEGHSCRSQILSASGYCYNHDPERGVEDGYHKALEARARMKRKGTARLTKVYTRLEKAMRQVERGELEPEIAVAMAQLARTMCAILDLDEPGKAGDTQAGLTPRF